MAVAQKENPNEPRVLGTSFLVSIGLLGYPVFLTIVIPGA